MSMTKWSGSVSETPSQRESSPLYASVQHTSLSAQTVLGSC